MITGSKHYARLFWSLLPPWAAPVADPCEDPHETVTVDGVALDLAIAPFIVDLWRRGIATYNSCQGDPGLYRLHASRHHAEGTPTGNPYAAYITVDPLESAHAVAEMLAPPAQNWVTFSADGVPVGRWWFVHFHPSLLQHWLAARPPHSALGAPLDNDSSVRAIRGQ